METIKKYLTEIEQQHGVKVLFACETGSRAWGFPSPDSDYDVRFLYMHERDWYLSLSKQKDTIEFIDGDWDISGWDLRKALLMLMKSNLPLIERFQSPINYYDQPAFSKEFRNLIEQFYSPTAVFFHHYSLATNFWEELQSGNDHRLKDLFYLVRSLLSCNWIINDKKVVPMHIEPLLKNIDSDIDKQLRQLIRVKATKDESYRHPNDPGLWKWITEMFALLESKKQNLGVANGDTKLMNKFFIKTIYD
jgi:uncharacterized protein